MLEGRTHATRTQVTLLRCRAGTSEVGAALQLDLWRRQEDKNEIAAGDGGDAARACEAGRTLTTARRALRALRARCTTANCAAGVPHGFAIRALAL